MGGINTPGEWQIILNQLLIVSTGATSFIILKERYNWKQALGASILIVGAVVAILPGLISPAAGQNAVWYFVIVYAASNIPAGLSYSFKELYFKKSVRLLILPHPLMISPGH